MPFQPGQSGNPGGQTKTTKAVRELAQQYTEEAIKGLAEIARNKKEPAAARAAAWNSLLDRGHGKPVQGVEHSGPEGAALIVQIVRHGDDPTS